MAYDFSTLDNYDFEKFARDILNATFQLDLQDFKPGKDGGIDLRHSTPANQNAIIVQAKHWLKSGYEKLYAELEDKELPKIKLLAPDRYILVTSIPLNPQQKGKLLQLLTPHIRTTNDILGQEDLNKYLSNLPDIEKRWFKLWLTSTAVMQQILHNGQYGTNAFAKEKIVRTIQRYVHCPSYDVAFKLIQEHKYIMITGQPGVGKTTLAHLLTYQYLAKGFELLYIDTEISQATSLLSSDPNTKQIIFFDDFLGATYLELNNPKTSETALVNFLERIQLSENKLLILTTRTTIYNNAMARYEKLGRMRVDIARKEIALDHYSILDKARILQKHIFYSNLQQELKDMFVSNKNYWPVIQRLNYNPRLIEFITTPKYARTENEQIYWEFVNKTLNNPQEVWRHFYQYQLSVEERLLLHVIFLQNDSTPVANTNRMFQHALDYEKKFYNYTPGLNPFQTACKQLLDGTIKQDYSSFRRSARFSFINPSLEDFLKHFFRQSEEERRKLLEAASMIEQFENFHQKCLVRESPGNEPLEETTWFSQLLVNRSSSLDSYLELRNEANRKQYIILRSASLFFSTRITHTATRKKVIDFIAAAVRQYPVEQVNTHSKDYYINIISQASSIKSLQKHINDNWNTIIYNLFRSCEEEKDFYAVKKLFEKYPHAFKEYLAIDNNEEELTELIEELADFQTKDWIDSERGVVLSGRDWKSLKEEIKDRRYDLFALFSLTDETYDESDYFNDDDLPGVIKANKRRTDAERIDNHTTSEQTDDVGMVKQIELLFTGTYDEDFVSRKSREI